MSADRQRQQHLMMPAVGAPSISSVSQQRCRFEATITLTPWRKRHQALRLGVSGGWLPRACGPTMAAGDATSVTMSGLTSGMRLLVHRHRRSR